MKYIKSKMLYIIIILLTLVMGLSYSIFVVTTNKTDVANLKISNLLYGINIFEEGSNAPINGSSLIMEPNSEKSLYITIYNVNKIETRYALAYQGNVSVSVSSRSNWNPNGNASQYNNYSYGKTVKVLVKNNTSENQLVSFSSFGGLTNTTNENIVVPSPWIRIVDIETESLSGTRELGSIVSSDLNCLSINTCLYGAESDNFIKISSSDDYLYRIVGMYYLDGEQAIKVVPVDYENVTNFSIVNNSNLYETDYFDCTSPDGLSVTCSSSEEENIGSLTLDEASIIGFSAENEPTAYIKTSTSVIGQGTGSNPYQIAYTAFFNYNGGSGNQVSKTIIDGETYGELPVAQKSGYEFDGWFLDDQLVNDTTIVNTHGDITLTASYHDTEAPNINLSKITYIEGFNGWTLTDSHMEGDELVLDSSAARIDSPFIKTYGDKWYFTYEAYTTSASTRFTPNGGARGGYFYYDESKKATSALSNSTSNGYSTGLPLNEWTPKDNKTNSSYGNDVYYITLYFQIDEYSAATTKYRNFKIWGQLDSPFYYIDIDSSDNEGIVQMKYDKGNKDVNYFENDGIIINDSRLLVTENDTYTVYAVDGNGNKSVETIVVDRIVNNSSVYSYTGNVQTFIAPVSATYKVELWGAGMDVYNNSNVFNRASYGSYTSGDIHLNAGEELYVYVGEGSSKTRTNATYNGGGAATMGTYYNQYLNTGFWYSSTYAGAGATDVRLVKGNWDNAESLRSRIMVAAGASFGSAGGGLYSPDSGSIYTITGATQVSGGSSVQAPDKNAISSGTFGKGSAGDTQSYGYGSSGGGGGYYGGCGDYGKDWNNIINTTTGYGVATSGSSYISGHTGSVALASSSNNTPKAGCTTGTNDNSCSIHYSNKYFTNTVMIDGAGYSWSNVRDEAVTYLNPSGEVVDATVAGAGNGYARITLVNMN